MKFIKLGFFFFFSFFSYGQGNEQLVNTKWTIMLYEDDPSVVDSLIFLEHGVFKYYHVEFDAYSSGSYIVHGNKAYLGTIGFLDRTEKVDYYIRSESKFLLEKDKLIYKKIIEYDEKGKTNYSKDSHKFYFNKVVKRDL